MKQCLKFPNVIVLDSCSRVLIHSWCSRSPAVPSCNVSIALGAHRIIRQTERHSLGIVGWISVLIQSHFHLLRHFPLPSRWRCDYKFLYPSPSCVASSHPTITHTSFSVLQPYIGLALLPSHYSVLLFPTSSYPRTLNICGMGRAWKIRNILSRGVCV